MLNIIPFPHKVEEKSGFFALERETKVICENDNAVMPGKLLAEYLDIKENVQVGPVSGEEKCIIFKCGDKTEYDADGFAKEWYRLEVREDGIAIEAENDQGLFRAVQVLRQLAADGKIPCADIESSPEFRWRGLHLDVCRHFITAEEVKQFIDRMAMYNYNIFHWHLTEDQGWRIEIKRYPKLTEIGSVRDYTQTGHYSDKPHRFDDKPHGGFYTREEISSVVEYASARGITIVPEIDMPGHMQAAISAYPELGNLDMQLSPRCIWGISQHILNPKEETIQFMFNVLEEVMELFPSRYIHIGGDEALKREWEETRAVQERMAELGLKGEKELQSWFIGRMVDFIGSKGRKVIGWDEILEGGLPEGAAVMSWRGEDGGREAAKLGHGVVMAPNQNVYFDYYQRDPETHDEPLAIGGLTTIEKVYDYYPVPEDFSEDETACVMGSQGQLWTEYMPDFSSVLYMAYPRACALAEVLWTGKNRPGFASFSERLEAQK